MHDGGTLGARSEVRLERHSGTAVVVLGDGRRGTARAATMLLQPALNPGRRAVGDAGGRTVDARGRLARNAGPDRSGQRRAQRVRVGHRQVADEAAARVCGGTPPDGRAIREKGDD